jgi:hypothetical protein
VTRQALFLAPGLLRWKCRKRFFGNHKAVCRIARYKRKTTENRTKNIARLTPAAQEGEGAGVLFKRAAPRVVQRWYPRMPSLSSTRLPSSRTLTGTWMRSPSLTGAKPDTDSRLTVGHRAKTAYRPAPGTVGHHHRGVAALGHLGSVQRRSWALAMAQTPEEARHAGDRWLCSAEACDHAEGAGFRRRDRYRRKRFPGLLPPPAIPAVIDVKPTARKVRLNSLPFLGLPLGGTVFGRSTSA